MSILDSVLNSFSHIPNAPRATREYFQEHTLNDGFELSANNLDHYLQAHHAPNWLGGVAGSVLSAGQLLFGIPVGMREMARVTIEASPQGWQHTIGALGSFVIHGMLQGVGFITSSVSNWGNGSLNNESSFQISRQVTLTAGAAGMMLMGARNMARGGGNFFNAARISLQNVGEMSFSPATGAAAVSSIAALPVSGLPELGLGVFMSSASSPLAPRPEEVVSIPGGRYVRGSRGPSSFEDETPHVVETSPFRILRTSFTNAMRMEYWARYFSTPFAIIGRDQAGIWRVVQRGRSEAELQAFIGDNRISLQPGYRVNSNGVIIGGRAFTEDSLSIHRVVPQEPHFQQRFAAFEQPAVHMDWPESVSLADAMGGHLATEAQWEAAARGPIVNVTERMSAEGVPTNRFAEFVAGPEINGRHDSGRFGRYENFVPVDPATGQMMGTEFFTNPSDSRIQGMLRERQAIGAWRVFSTESGALEEPAIWSSVTRARSATRPVMEGRPGPFGVRDMNGNVWEWGNDPYGPYTPANAGGVLRDPTGPASGFSRVLRGGSWVISNPRFLRAANRYNNHPGNSYNDVGSRAVFSAQD